LCRFKEYNLEVTNYINPKAFYSACGCGYHSLNLVLFGMTNSCPRATSFSEVLHCIYTLFSSSTKRWKILQNHIHNLTFKSLSQTRFQALQIRYALFELVETNDDPKIKGEVECLTTYEPENFEFLLGMTIWYDILFVFNSSKNLQSKDMCINMAIEQLKGLLSFFETYRENGFENAFISAKEIASEMDVEPKFHEKRTSGKKNNLMKILRMKLLNHLKSSLKLIIFYIL